jgi:hypothetical protein
MNQRATVFEMSVITLFYILGVTLPAFSIASSGVLGVAGILTLIFVTSHYKSLAGFVNLFAPKAILSSAHKHNSRER